MHPIQKCSQDKLSGFKPHEHSQVRDDCISTVVKLKMSYEQAGLNRNAKDRPQQIHSHLVSTVTSTVAIMLAITSKIMVIINHATPVQIGSA